jgi:hypothetical protein
MHPIRRDHQQVVRSAPGLDAVIGHLLHRGSKAGRRFAPSAREATRDPLAGSVDFGPRLGVALQERDHGLSPHRATSML